MTTFRQHKTIRQAAWATAVFNLLVLIAWSTAHASSGSEGASFLDIPVGAEPAALGSAYSALATNAYAPTWNPGALGFIDGNELAGQHLSYLESIHYEYLSFVHPLGDDRDSSAPTHRGIGFSAQYLGSGDITRTDVDANGNYVSDGGTFSSHYAAYNVSYGQTVMDKLSLGFTGKWINAKIDDVSANAYAFDLGSLYKVTPKVNVAATVTNVGTKLKFLSEGDSLPAAGHIAATYTPDSHWMITTEGVYEEQGLASYHIGGEWRPVQEVSLRAGYKTDTLKGLSAEAGITAGVGIHMWGQEFSYAWAPYGDLGDAQYFSLLIHFGEREEQKRNLIQYQTIKSHRTVKSNGGQTSEPEYQQLMQLLSDEDSHVAQSGSVNSGN